MFARKEGLINAIPYFVAGVAMYWVGRNSDKTGERRWHIAVAALTAAVGFLVAATVSNPYIAMAGLTVAFAGLKYFTWNGKLSCGSV